jgi:DNA polymerase-1
MLPTGSDDPLIYVLGEAPGKVDDEHGEPFIGRIGELIRDYIPKELENHIRWNNTINCRPPDNRTPTREEMVCCSQRQVADIERTKPIVIMGFGSVPLNWATDESGITDWRGTLVPVRIGTHTCWYAPLWHPSYILRAKNDQRMGEAFFETYKKDLKHVFDSVATLEEPFVPQGDELDAGITVELSYSLDEVHRNLSQLEGHQSVDIETNGIRPYAADSKILSIAFGTWEFSYAIPILHREAQWPEHKLKTLWGIIGKHLRKAGNIFTAHHLKFEQEWLSMPWALGRSLLFEVQWGDTMAQAEVLRTQSMYSKGLDVRCVAEIGIHVKTLDDLDRKRLDFLPLPKVLKYNARDTKFTDLLRRTQDKRIECEGLQVAYALMVDRCPALTIAQQGGVVPDTVFAEAKHVELQASVEKMEEKIQQLPDVRALVKETGKPFNSGSPMQLSVLLRDRLKLPEGWRMVGGVRKYSTDEEVLSKIKHPIGKLILEKRGLAKLDGTYVLGGCRKESFPTEKGCGKLLWADGLIHTNYNHLLAATGRTSADSPNLQNYPKREHKEIRNCIMAPPGHKMVSVDYGQIEARVIAMASRCPVLVKSMWDHYDIHMAWAKTISEKFEYVMTPYLKEAKKDEVKALKNFRSDVKNQWTFPLFFGSQLGAVAAALKIPAGDLQPHFNRFWEMFSEVKRWQERVIKSYHAKGYVETLTGRRRYEPLSYNEAINSPIQGCASDIVVDAMTRLATHAYETGQWQRAARLEIHDDLGFYLPDETVEQDIEIILPIMLETPFDFVNVPLTVEVAIGRRWGELEDMFSLESTELEER